MDSRVEFEPIESAKPNTSVESASPGNVPTGYGLNGAYDDNDEIKARILQRKQEALKKKQKARSRRKLIFWLLVVGVALLIFSFTNFFAVDYIDVRGNSYYTAEEVINIAHATPGSNLIYHPNKKSIVSYLEDNPYIKNAKVSRHFPSTLVITVEERQQIGAIKYDKNYLIIDDEGVLLRKTKSTPKLTLIEGVVVRKMAEGEELGVQDQEILTQTLAILKKAKKKDLYYVRLDMSNMYILAYIYDSLVCKGTYKQLITTMDNNRLHLVIDRLFEDNIKRGTITFSSEGYVSYLPTI